MKEIPILVAAYMTVHLLHFLCNGQSSCTTTGDVRLYNSYGSSTNEGSVQTCYYGTWYSVCDYDWNCAEGNVVCRQLGLGMARETIRYSYNYFGSWQYIRPYYYYCYGSETSLNSCNNYYVDSWYCEPYDDEAGVRCTGPLGDACSEEGDVRLIGGSNGNEGNLEYCYSGAWTHFCSLDDEEATVACKQLGHYQYKWASILSSGTFSTSTNYSLVTLSCSSTAAEYKLRNCTVQSSSSSSSSCASTFPTCLHPVGIRCYDPGACTEGAVRLADGVLEQEGRVEVCIQGVWGSICGTGWSKVDGYVLCKEAGFDDAEPTIYTNSKFGDGYGPIVYSGVRCNGWEKSLTECPKYEYLQFTCSRSSVAGVLCHDDCKSGDVRLSGGDYDWEGTVEVCFDRLWGTIVDSSWDSNDAAVICKQLGYPTNGVASAVLQSFYDKPNRTVHFSNVACLENEQTISQCSKSTYSLQDGKSTQNSVEVAGVQCLNYDSPATHGQPCLSAPDMIVPQCNESDLQLIGGSSPNEGRLEFCYQQQWSPFCTLHHVEASVACKQLGYTKYAWAAIITSGEFGTSQNYSLFDNVTCSDTASEYSLGRCKVNVGTCLNTCTHSIGIRCFEYGTCTEGDSRIADGLVAQEGRVEVCVSGVWGSICSTGWDTNDANVVCRQLGFPGSKPIPYYSFGAGTGPVVYSKMGCNGWENSLSECTSESYLAFNCPPLEAAGVFCADYCFAGEIRLVGGDSEAEGTVEICLDNLWGLIDESGWGINDARVVCEQLGYGTAGAQPVHGSLYGKPNKPIHASGVFCLGDEEELIECTLTLNSLNDGRLHLDHAQVAGVSCAGHELTSTPTATLMLASNIPETLTACLTTTTSGPKTTVTISATTTTTKVISSVSSVTTTTIVTSTTSITFYSTLTSTSVSATTLTSTETTTQLTTSTVTTTDTTTKLSISTVASTSTQPVPTTVYVTATVRCTGTCTTTQTFTGIVTETSTVTTTAETCTAKPPSTITTTSYLPHPGSSLSMSCNSSPQFIADNLAIDTFSEQIQTESPTSVTTNTVAKESPAISSSSINGAVTADQSSSASSSTLLMAVALVFILTAIIVVISAIMVVLIIKKHTKQQHLNRNSSSKVDSLPTSSPNQYTMQESVVEMEKEKLAAAEEGKDAMHEDQDTLEAPQDHSDSETGM